MVSFAGGCDTPVEHPTRVPENEMIFRRYAGTLTAPDKDHLQDIVKREKHYPFFGAKPSRCWSVRFEVAAFTWSLKRTTSLQEAEREIQDFPRRLKDANRVTFGSDHSLLYQLSRNQSPEVSTRPFPRSRQNAYNMKLRFGSIRRGH